MFSSGLDGRTQVLDLSNNTVGDYFYQTFFLISLVNFKPQVTALENEVFQRAGDRYFCIFLLCKKNLLFVICVCFEGNKMLIAGLRDLQRIFLSHW